MSSNEYTKWLAIGTGAGIEIGERDLDVTLVRVRPTGADVLGALHIEGYAQRPAAEWGAAYASFLRSHGLSHLIAAALLPRRDVIVRQLALPGVASRDLAQAVAFQLDGLHPFAEDEAVHAWARMDDGVNVLVGITRREVIERYIQLFAEAGIKISALTFSAAVLYGSRRLLGAPPGADFLAVVQGGGEVEAYGESSARPVFSATFDTPNPQFTERARVMAMAELRLDPETPWRPVHEVLPQPRRIPEGLDSGAWPLAYATALMAACPRFGLRVNLLPRDVRANSRMMFLPTIALAVLLLAGAAALAGYSAWQDRQYLAHLRAEIARLEPEARKPMLMDRAIENARARTFLLDQFRKHTHADLDALAELTKILEPPAWASSLDIMRDSVRISGTAPQAAGLLKTVDQSPLFEGSASAAPMTRAQDGENFVITAHREGVAK